MLDYVNNEFTIGYKNKSNIINKFHKCTTESTIYQYSCLVDYIILGNEIDIYLAKSLEKITLIFDNLSYYSIFPLEQLDYFLQEFFSEIYFSLLKFKMFSASFASPFFKR